MNKLLSIIVPSYNMEQYLPKCLASLIMDDTELQQKLDVIVVNDGSKDRTSEIAHGFETKYPGVFRVIDKPNGHYGSCVNAGLSIAKGMFVKLLDADDSFDTEQCKRSLLELISAEQDGKLKDVDAVITDYSTVDETEKVQEVKKFGYPEKSPFGMACFQSELKFHILHQGIAFRRSILVESHYQQTEGCPYTDLEWVTMPIRFVRNFYYLPCAVYRYLIGREGQSVQQETFVRNVNVILKLITGMLRRYQQLLDPSRPAVQQYVDKMMLAQLEIIYRSYLVDGRKWYRFEELKEFDALLKNSSRDLYHASDFTIKSNWFTFHYVENFRKPSLLNRIKRRLFFAYIKLAALRSRH